MWVETDTHMQSIANNMVALSMPWIVVSVNVVICAGARTDIENQDGDTPLETAANEKVHVDPHTT